MLKGAAVQGPIVVPVTRHSALECPGDPLPRPIIPALFMPTYLPSASGETECGIYIHSAICSALKRNSTDTCYNMDEPQDVMQSERDLSPRTSTV